MLTILGNPGAPKEEKWGDKAGVKLTQKGQVKSPILVIAKKLVLEGTWGTSQLLSCRMAYGQLFLIDIGVSKVGERPTALWVNNYAVQEIFKLLQ